MSTGLSRIERKLILPPEAERTDVWKKQFVDNYWMQLGDTSQIHTVNPFHRRTKYDLENPHVFVLDLMRRPENFWFTAKYIFGKTLPPYQLAILHEMWIRSFPMLIGSRGLGKSFLGAFYIMLRALFYQGSRIIICGAAFRQAKVVFDYCQDIWEKAPVLRDLADSGKGPNKNGPRRDVDRCTLRIGDSLIVAIPLGDGTKIRGQRANIILADEFACLEAGTLVETDIGLMRIEDGESRYQEIAVVNRDGELEQPTAFIKTPPTTAYRITTVGGYEFVCSGIHQVETTQGWKLGKELTCDDYLISENKYQFPLKTVCHDGVVVDADLAWLMGILVAEGSIADKHSLSVHMTDVQCVLRVRRAFRKYCPDSEIGFSVRDAYVDDRGWVCKESYTTYVCCLEWRDKLESIGLERSTALSKRTPWSILQSSRDVMIAYLSGLFEGDGSAFLWLDRGIPNHLGVAFYTASLALCKEVQTILQKLGFFCTRQKRKSEISDNPQWMLRLNGEQAHELANLLDIAKWQPTLREARTPWSSEYSGVVWDKSRNKWKAEIYKEGKNHYLGRFLTKEEAWACVREHRPNTSLRVKSVEKLDGEQVLYDFYLPKTHSFYANGFVQHNSIPVDIFETVVRGFAAVSKDPILALQREARVDAMKVLGAWDDALNEDERETIMSNQTIISGTAYYAFNHFYSYWRQYKAIIESRGDIQKLREIFGGDPPETFNWRDYCVMRIPYSRIPKGPMDANQVAQGRATMHTGIYQMEFEACFATDSNGFFKRSLIEGCVVGRPGFPITMSCGDVRFTAVLRGKPQSEYIIAVDPASEHDNFSIVVLELWSDHRRIVHCWTTTRARFKAKMRKGLVEEKDFYAYAARKIRELRRTFHGPRIAIDSQGGGVPIMEALQDPDKMNGGEKPFYPIIIEGEEQATDDLPGEHILEVISFAKADWVRDANHGLRKDMEDKVLLFPEFDSALLGLAIEEDKAKGRVKVDESDSSVEKLYDTLEDCVMEIEELKDELATIVHTQTGTTLRDHWDTPETKLAGGKKGRQRKDRYSSLLMANMVARTLQRAPGEVVYQEAGGFVGELKGRSTSGQMWAGNHWANNIVSDGASFGAVVTRRR